MWAGAGIPMAVMTGLFLMLIHSEDKPEAITFYISLNIASLWNDPHIQ